MTTFNTVRAAQIHKHTVQSLMWKAARREERMEQVLQSLIPEKISLEHTVAV